MEWSDLEGLGWSIKGYDARTTQYISLRRAGLSLAPEGGLCLGPGPGGRGSAVYRLPGGAGGELEAVLRLGGEEEDTVAGWAGADCGPLYVGGLAGSIRV